jgi:ParB family chromosome partitioning protein
VAALAGIEGKPSSRAKFSGEVEWYIPEEYLALAREVMGAIDLDPASTAEAQKTIKAKKFFSPTTG